MATITGTSGNDNLTGTAGNDVIDGGDGNDEITGGLGTDILNGGAGDDTLSDESGGGEIRGGDGADTILAAPHYDMVAPLLLHGGNDNDFIFFSSAQSGQVTIDGGNGSDHVLLHEVAGTVDISLGASRDRLTFNLGHISQHGTEQVAMNAITVQDFATGSSGDVLEWLTYLGESLIGWDQTSNPFGVGFARLVQSGSGTLLQIDLDGSAGKYGYQTLLTLESTTRTAFAAANFSGYNPNGAHPSGTTLNGTALGDDLNGTFGADVIRGLGSNDVIWTGPGSDRAEGGDGNDLLLGEVGHDILLGGNGDDILDGNAGDDRAEGGEGGDSLRGGHGNDTLLGGGGNDYIYDVDGTNHIDGGDGDDEIRANVWSLSTGLILGGLGNDTVYLQAVGSALVDLGAGADIFEAGDALGGSAVIDLRLGSGLDTIRFTAALRAFDSGLVIRDFDPGAFGEQIDWGESLSGLIGWDDATNPFFTGHLRVTQSGSQTLLEVDLDADDFNHGFVTIATFADTPATDLTTENLGGYSPIPVRNGTAGANNVNGTSAAERLNGLGRNDVLKGNGGDDILVGGTGADQTHGGTGNDVHVVDNVADRVFELSGQGHDRVDSLVTFVLPDHVEDLKLGESNAIDGTGNTLANRLTGNSAANVLRGSDGNDVLDGREGADRMEGGRHDDLYFVDDSGDLIVELSGQGTDTVMSQVSFTLRDHVEHLILSGGPATDATGNGLANTITGNDLANRLDGGAGADTLIGGKGNDNYVVDNVGDVVVEAAAGGTDSVYSSADYALSSQVERLILIGKSSIDGRGNGGNNIVTGNSGNNLLNGGNGNDRVDGGAGNDSLYGDAGHDDLVGGAGNDRFLFNTALGATNVDDILDFNVANDTILLARYVFTRAGTNGTLSAAAFRQGTAAADASDRIIYDQANGNIFYDSDGTGAAAQILFATVTDGTSLTSADFIVYG